MSTDPTLVGTMLMSWNLRATNEGTEVSMVCENVPSGIDAADHAEGMRSSLENLARYLDHG